jgi:uncharacterized protein
MNLPVFKYHPDPIATGSIVRGRAQCMCCGEMRDYFYVGPVYAKDDLDESICPWCIDNGLAHEKYGASFTDRGAIGGFRELVPREVTEEVAYRTPGFSGWQQECWLAHCGDACAFLGAAGKEGVEAYNSQELLDSIRANIEMKEEEFQGYLNALNTDFGPTAYVFRCLHCSQYLGYSDFT